MENNYSNIPVWLKRDCELRGISVAKFFEIQEKWSVFFDNVRQAFITGELIVKK